MVFMKIEHLICIIAQIARNGKGYGNNNISNKTNIQDSTHYHDSVTYSTYYSVSMNIL